MVLTSSTCRIHGWGRGSGDESSGSLVLSGVSSSAASFQTMSLLSLPCLLSLIMLSGSSLWRPATTRHGPRTTYVISRSCPQPAMPKMAP